MSLVSFPLSAADLPPSPTKSSNLSETAEVPACNVPSRSPLPALAIAPETKLGTASDRKSGSAGMPRPISYAVFCLKKKKTERSAREPDCNRYFTIRPSLLSHFFFFNDTATTEIYTLSLHDALPIFSGRLATKSNQIKQLIRNGRSASLQRTFKKSFTSFSHSTRNKTRDGLIRVRNIRALNGRFNTSITHAYSIVIGSKHITLNATGGGFLTASKQFRHGATSKSRSNTASNSTKHKSPHLSGWRQIISLIT